MPVRLQLFRRLLLACAAATGTIALLIAVIVIPGVSADTFAAGTPEQALPAFWGLAATATVTGLLLVLMAVPTRVRRFLAKSVLGLATASILLIALRPNDAAMAYCGPGPAMRGVSPVAFACAGVSLIVATAVLSTAFLLPRAVAGDL